MLITDIAPPSSSELCTFLQSSIRMPATAPAADHDDGLAHNHHWATERTQAPCESDAQPRIAHAAALRTPSCVTHDDIHYGRD